MSDERATGPFLVRPDEGEPLLAAVQRAMVADASSLRTLPVLSELAQRDAYLAQQLAALHAGWQLRPVPAPGLLARLRTRLAWWLLGPELGQISVQQAAAVRVIDSLVAHLDAERAAHAVLAARLHVLEREP